MNKAYADRSAASAGNTLLLSFLVNLPGPIVIGFGLSGGISYTLLAEFIRKTLVVLSIAFSYAIHSVCHRKGFPEERKRRYERIANLSVGAVMCLSGVAFLSVAFLPDPANGGNVLTGLVISALSAILNLYFYFRSRRLAQNGDQSILAAQGKMNLSRMMLDCAVCLVYLLILASLGDEVTRLVDSVGSAVVSLVVLFYGVRMIRSERRGRLDG